MKNISNNFSEFKYIVPSYVGNQLALERYWRGPIWINTNWMLFIGLQNYGKFNLAEKIKKNSLKLIEKNGFYEYFNPKTGHGIGANNFSWTAALYLDFLEN
jgi:glycogen debranching enzyme